jgi:hypothetical protein
MEGQPRKRTAKRQYQDRFREMAENQHALIARTRRLAMAVNKPTGDNAREGAVKKRSQLKTTLGGATAWTKRNRTSGEFMGVKKPSNKKAAAKKFKGVREDKKSVRW